jgi:uncharacterized CHY-type Zn-finger protein
MAVASTKTYFCAVPCDDEIERGVVAKSDANLTHEAAVFNGVVFAMLSADERAAV